MTDKERMINDIVHLTTYTRGWLIKKSPQEIFRIWEWSKKNKHKFTKKKENRTLFNFLKEKYRNIKWEKGNSYIKIETGGKILYLYIHSKKIYEIHGDFKMELSEHEILENVKIWEREIKNG